MNEVMGETPAPAEGEIQVYARSRALEDRIRRILTEVADVQLVGRWRQLLSGPDKGGSIVFGATGHLDSSTVQRLATIRGARRRSALILISPRNPDSVRRVSGIRIEAVVWLNEVETNLVPMVQKSRRLEPIRRVTAAVSESQELAVPLRDALLLATHPANPVRTVGGLSQMVGRDRRSLTRQWRAFVGSGHSLTLQTLLGWLTLLEGVARKTPARSWEAVARETGVSVRTLRRLSRRHTGVPLSRWAEWEPEYLLRRLLETEGGEALSRALGELESGADPLI